MASTHPVKSMIDSQPTFSKPLTEILAELEVGGALKTLTPLEHHTAQQRRWWKGVLLPALSEANGDAKPVWEIRLKLAVLPDVFCEHWLMVDGHPFAAIASINTLSKKKMSELIEGSVAILRDKWGFDWVTPPDKELRR